MKGWHITVTRRNVWKLSTSDHSPNMWL